MKLRKLLPLLVLPFVSVTACQSLFGNANDVDYMYKKSTKFKNYRLMFSEKAWRDGMRDADLAIEENDFDKMMANEAKISQQLSNLREDTSYLDAVYNGDLDDEARAKKIALANVSTETLAWVRDHYTKIKNSDFKTKFFTNLTDEQIDALIASYNPSSNQVMIEVNNLVNDYSLNLNNPLMREDPDAYELSMIEKYKRIAEKYEEIATLSGYDSALQYLYDNPYNHRYTVEDMRTYISQSKSCFIDSYKASYIELDLTTSKEVDVLNDFNSYYFDKPNVQGMKIMDAVGKVMNPKYAEAFNSLFKKGMYFFSGNPRSLGTAYIDDAGFEPIAYFSKNYQNLLTVVHEFGHYYAAKNGANSQPLPYDLYETHSQGNEFLVLAYLENNWNFGWREKAFKAFEKVSHNARLRDLCNILEGVECEMYIFDNYKTKTAEELKNGINEITKTYLNAGVNPYYYLYTGTSAGYYSGYLTSLVASIDLYTIALKDYSKAVDIYESLINTKSVSSMRKTYTDVGLIDYQNITQVRNLLNKFLEIFTTPEMA